MQQRYKICFAIAAILFFMVGPVNNTLSFPVTSQRDVSCDLNGDVENNTPLQLSGDCLNKENSPDSSENTPSRAIENTREDLPKIGTISRTLEIAPGQRYYAYLDYEEAVLVEKHIPDSTVLLPQTVKDAIELVPEWLHDDLEYTFTTLTSDDSTIYAQEILDSADPRYVDEIAFCIAHSHRGLLERLIETSESHLFAENAEDIYAMNDRNLDYAELVEKTDHTTLSYKSGFGGSHELEKDNYYWYVVYPRTHIELPHNVDVEGTPRFWRSYFPDNSDYGTTLYDAVKNATTIYNAAELLGTWLIDFMEFAYGWNGIQPIAIWRNPTQCSCGQYTIITGALAKTMLIPTTGLGTHSEDHAWNEFYDTKWIHWDTSLGDKDANEINIINSPGTYDPDSPNGYGGTGGALGKQVSTVYMIRGDEAIYQSLQYTPYGTLKIMVTDKNDEPVDGAKILLYPATLGTNNPDRGSCMWGYTDSLGSAVFQVGNKLDYFAKSIHPILGTIPEGDQIVKVAANVQNGNTYNFNIKYADNGDNSLNVTEKNSQGSGIVKIISSFKVESERQWCENEETKAYGLGIRYPFDTVGQSITSFICDSENFNNYLSGDHFDAYELNSRTDQKNILFESDMQKDWYLVLSNEHSYVTTKTVNITMDVFFRARPVVEITGPRSGSLLWAGSSIPVGGTVFSPNTLTSLAYSIDQGEWQDITDKYNEAMGIFSFYWSPASLDAGEHTLEVRVEDSVSDMDTDICTVFLDAAPPMLDISDPGNGSFFREGEKIGLSGNVSDDIGPTSLFLDIRSTRIGGRILISGENITSAVSAGQFTYYFFTDDLDVGEYRIELRAVDRVGLESYERQWFYIDIEEPVITISEPVGQEIVGGPSTIHITGTAMDDIGLASLELETSSGHRADLLSNLNGTFWKYDWNASGLESERYSIRVSGIDGIGRWVQVSVFVELDNDLPEIKIEKDYDTIISGGREIDFTGTAADENELEIIEAAIIFSSSSPGSDRRTIESNETEWINISESAIGSKWLFHWDTSDLSSGNYTFAVRATDEVGNVAVETIRVFIDATDPILNFNLRSPGEIPVVTGVVTINGTAFDNLEITALDLSWKTKSRKSLLNEYDGITWTYKWDTSTLDSGEYIIEIRAEDQAGRETVLRQGIIVDNDLPEITAHSNSKSTPLHIGDALILTGKALDANGLSSVIVKIDEGAWSAAYLNNGAGEWEFRYNTGELNGGKHTATIRVEDIVGLNVTKTLRFTLVEQNTGGNVMRIAGIKWYYSVTAMAIIVVMLLFIVFYFVVKRRKKMGEKREVDYFCLFPKEPESTEDSEIDLFLPPLEDVLLDIPDLSSGSMTDSPPKGPDRIDDRTEETNPVCTRCGVRAEYLLEYDCFWCKKCKDYVRGDASHEPDEKSTLELNFKLPGHYKKNENGEGKSTLKDGNTDKDILKEYDAGSDTAASTPKVSSSIETSALQRMNIPALPALAPLVLSKLPPIGEKTAKGKAHGMDKNEIERPRKITRKKVIKKMNKG
jgi:hypothetical protein